MDLGNQRVRWGTIDWFARNRRPTGVAQSEASPRIRGPHVHDENFRAIWIWRRVVDIRFNALSKGKPLPSGFRMLRIRIRGCKVQMVEYIEKLYAELRLDIF